MILRNSRPTLLVFRMSQKEGQRLQGDRKQRIISYETFISKIYKRDNETKFITSYLDERLGNSTDFRLQSVTIEFIYSPFVQLGIFFDLQTSCIFASPNLSRPKI